jgi:hypothetical protein
MTRNETKGSRIAQQNRTRLGDWLLIIRLALSHGFGHLTGRTTHKSFIVSGSPVAFENSYESILEAFDRFSTSRLSSQTIELKEPNSEVLPYTPLPALTRAPGSITKTLIVSGSPRAIKSKRHQSRELFGDLLNSHRCCQLFFLEEPGSTDRRNSVQAKGK